MSENKINYYKIKDQLNNYNMASWTINRRILN